jgi:hypothetical protein
VHRAGLGSARLIIIPDLGMFRVNAIARGPKIGEHNATVLTPGTRPGGNRFALHWVCVGVCFGAYSSGLPAVYALPMLVCIGVVGCDAKLTHLCQRARLSLH